MKAFRWIYVKILTFFAWSTGELDAVKLEAKREARLRRAIKPIDMTPAGAPAAIAKLVGGRVYLPLDTHRGGLRVVIESSEGDSIQYLSPDDLRNVGPVVMLGLLARDHVSGGIA